MGRPGATLRFAHPVRRDRPGLLRVPGRRAVQEHGRPRHVPALGHEVGDRVAHGEEGGGVLGPASLSSPDDLAHRARHPRQARGFGVVVGDVVDEAPAGRRAAERTTGRQMSDCAEDVGVGRHRDDRVGPGTRSSRVGQHSSDRRARWRTRSSPTGASGRSTVARGRAGERAADEGAHAVRQGAEGRADTAVDVESDQPHAGCELLALGRARSGPAEDRQPWPSRASVVAVRRNRESCSKTLAATIVTRTGGPGWASMTP